MVRASVCLVVAVVVVMATRLAGLSDNYLTVAMSWIHASLWPNSREADYKAGAAQSTCFDGDSAAVRLHDGLDDSQAQA